MDELTWGVVRSRAEAFAQDLERTQQALADCSGHAAVGQRRLEECEARVRALQAEREALSGAMERSARCDGRMEVYQTQLQTLRQRYTELVESLNHLMTRSVPGAKQIGSVLPASTSGAPLAVDAAPPLAATPTLAAAAAAAAKPRDAATMALGAIRW